MNRFGVAKLEQGVREPSWATVQALARALGIEVGEFVVPDAPPPPAKDKRPDKTAGTPSRQKKPAGGNLADRPAGQPVWPGSWHERGADMLRDDLEAAGIPYVVEGPDGPLHADFHALRHSYVALLDRAGLTLKQAMQLARHSDPKLTMAVYGRAALHDLGPAVDRLPGL